MLRKVERKFLKCIYIYIIVMLLIYILIGIFLVLFGYQIFLTLFPEKIIEGLENESTTDTTTNTSIQYQPYNISDPNNSLILPQQNAGNIEVLKARIDNFDGVKEQIDTMQQNIDSMQVQMDSLVQQQAQFAQDLAGDTPPEVTGTEELTVEEVEDDIEE
jgi:hypothetical protein